MAGYAEVPSSGSFGLGSEGSAGKCLEAVVVIAVAGRIELAERVELTELAD